MSCTIVDNDGSKLMTVKMKDKSFSVEWKKPKMNVLSAYVDELTLWHKRFGHYNYVSLKNLSYMNLTQHLLVIQVVNEVCDVFQFHFE